MKRFAQVLIFAISIAIFSQSAWAGNIGIYPKFKAWNYTTGTVLALGKLYTYAPGTDTPKAVYTDVALTIPASNPVVLDANGEADIYLNGSYNFVMKTSSGATVWTKDNVDTSGLAAASNVEAAAKTSTSVALTPGNVPSVMAAPGAIGGTTPAAGTFTTLKVTGGTPGQGKILAGSDALGTAAWSSFSPKQNILPNSAYSVCSQCYPTSSGSNLTTNADAWTGATGTTPPTGWTVGAQGTYSIETGGYGDTTALRITYNSATPSVYQDVAVTVGRTYILTGYFKKGTTNALVKLGLTSDDDYYFTATESTGSFVNFTWTFEATEATVRITLYQGGSAAQYADFDKVYLYEGFTAATADDATAPDHWEKDNDIDFYRTPYWYSSLPSAITDGAFYTAMLINGSGSTDEALSWPVTAVTTKHEHYKKFAGRQVAVGARVLATAASKARLCIVTSASTTCSDYHTGGSTWEWLEVSVTPPTSITSFAVELRPGLSTTSYFEPVMMVYGGSVGDGSYQPIPQETIYLVKPIIDQGYLTGKVFADVAWTDYNIETASAGRLPKNLNAVLLNSSIKDSAAATVRSYLAARADSSTTYSSYINDIGGKINSVYSSVTGWAGCDNSGDIELQIETSSTDTTKTMTVEQMSFVAVQLR